MPENSYWDMKYKLLEEQYEVQRRRNEELETRILEIVEKAELDKLALNNEIDQLYTKLQNRENVQSGPMRNDAEGPLLKADKPLTFPRKKPEDRKFYDIPLLSQPDGLLFGFRWTSSNVVKIV